MQDVAEIAGRIAGVPIKVRSVPLPLLKTAGFVMGRFNPMVKDLAAMIGWFQSGRYVAGTARQREVFGEPPAAEDAIRRLVALLGHPVRS